MGGHGGLNILPQKRWNVYNFDNREKVKEDEEAAAEKEKEQAEEQRRRDGEARLSLLRNRARQRLDTLGAEPRQQIDGPATVDATEPRQQVDGPASDAAVSVPLTHVNLFADFEEAARREATGGAADDALGEKPDRRKVKEIREKERSLKDQRNGKGEKEAEDERYRLGYGVVGKAKPWYSRKEEEVGEGGDEGGRRKRNRRAEEDPIDVMRGGMAAHTESKSDRRTGRRHERHEHHERASVLGAGPGVSRSHEGRNEVGRRGERKAAAAVAESEEATSAAARAATVAAAAAAARTMAASIGGSAVGNGSGGLKSVEQLRAERIAREHGEREKARALVIKQRAAEVRAGGGGGGVAGNEYGRERGARRYNSGYGYGR